MQRVLITGGSGLLAVNWACCMRESCDVVLATHTRKVDLKGARSMPLDLESADALAAGLEKSRPDLVVHTAGLTDVDRCEREPELARRLNATLAANVAVAARRLQIKLVHISTDHLFAGDKALCTEADTPSPLNFYARTKLEAEERVAAEHPGALIVRTNFFGWGHRYRASFSDWILDGLKNGRRLPMFDDNFFTPLVADRVARAVHALVAQKASGIYHLGGDERVSKHEFALRLARVFGLPEAPIERAKIAAASAGVKRPRDMSLDNSKARARLGQELGGVDSSLQELAHQERDGRARELTAAVRE